MIVYKTINKINGKWYIGKDSKNDPNYLGSGKLLKKAIQKYGNENFDKHILFVGENLDQIADVEKQFIEVYDAVNLEDSYNLAEGGNGGRTVQDTSGKNNPCYKGNPISDEKEQFVIENYKAGKGKAWIQKETGFSMTRITNILKWNDTEYVKPLNVTNPHNKLENKKDPKYKGKYKNRDLSGSKNGMYKNVDQSIQDEIVNLYSEGSTIKSLMDKFGFGRKLVNRIIKETKVNKVNIKIK